jgi:putative oxidoreductase
MSTTTNNEPRPIIKALGPFYEQTRDLSWLILRLTAGGMLLPHFVTKWTNFTFTGWASFALARRGIEPAIPLALIVWFSETVGAICIMLGLFTRLFVTMVGVQFLVIVYFKLENGFAWDNPKGGWEYPLFWGLVWLVIGLRGGGPYSLDRKLGREL